MKNLDSVIVILLFSFFCLITTSRAQTTPLNYPLSVGDSVEYFLIDTLSIEGQPIQRTFTLISIVENDTILGNGESYKKIEYKNIANYSNGRYWEEYLREDSSGSVFIFYEGVEYLLYDISLNVGNIYPSFLQNHTWEVVEKSYKNILVGNILTMKLNHRDGNGLIVESRTIAEIFGLISFSEEISFNFQGEIWGAKIEGTIYGELTIFDEIDWNEYYPLHVGDIWLYESTVGSISYYEIVRILSDTVYNNQHYFVRESIDLMWNNPSIDLVRIENDGRVYRRYFNQSPETNFLKFSLVVGDTIELNNLSTISRMNEKEYYTGGSFKFILLPDLTGSQSTYSYGLGYTFFSGEMASSRLIGAIIDGVVYGDTSLITSVHDKKDEINPSQFKLYQNYPNPFNPSTNIKFTIPEVITSGTKQSLVSLKVYDILGNEIATLVDEYKPAGTYKVEFSVDAIKWIVPTSGVYFYQFKAGSFTETRKMILLK